MLDVLTGAQAPEVGQLGAMPGGIAGGGPGIDQQQGVGMQGAGMQDTGLNSGALSDEDLAGMAADPNAVDYEDLQLQQMEAALNDPGTPPDQRAFLEQQLALAARRRMAGV